MKEIINLLRQKNDYLQQFERISSKAYHRLCLGDYSHIDTFYHDRQRLLNIMDQIDKQLNSITPVAVSEKDKKTMLSLIQEKKKITMSVLQKDLLIHSYLNDAQYDTAQEQIA